MCCYLHKQANTHAHTCTHTNTHTEWKGDLPSNTSALLIARNLNVFNPTPELPWAWRDRLLVFVVLFSLSSYIARAWPCACHIRHTLCVCVCVSVLTISLKTPGLMRLVIRATWYTSTAPSSSSWLDRVVRAPNSPDVAPPNLHTNTHTHTHTPFKLS